MKTIYFTVTNDLTYDQRMDRICTSLAENGYSITLVGRKKRTSIPLTVKKYKQKRLRCWWSHGKLFYAEYNIRLFFFLLVRKMDAICAIDLDTILATWYRTRLRKAVRIYDAHELFTEMKEVVTRPAVQQFWKKIERKTVPRFPHGYTVSESIAEEFNRRYGVNYQTIRNMPMLQSAISKSIASAVILYQGAVNEARGFESLIPAMKNIQAQLIICGDGNFMTTLQSLIEKNGVGDKVVLKGMLLPEELNAIAQEAAIGINLVENEGLNQYWSLANKFFDYIHAGLPQVTMNFPEYKKINELYDVAVLIDTTDPAAIAAAINNLLANDVVYRKLQHNCLQARQQLNWQAEEQQLLSFYQSLFY